MGNIQSHKDLKVWQDAMNAAMEIYTITGTFPAEEKYSLVDQIRRSSRSVAANLAEAWRRRRSSFVGYRRFLSTVRGPSMFTREVHAWDG
jgi:four helix bundle protein